MSRQVEPQLPEFLYALSASDGGDPTRDSDTGNSALRNGEPDGELGLIVQRDHGLWQQQTGGPTDPQAGNIPGGPRDILRTADFNGPGLNSFAVDSGVFQVSQGALSVAAASQGKDAAAVYRLDQYLPTYYEIAASVKVDKPTAGWKANAYIVFDYFSPTDFKFAGINVSTNKIEMGHRTETGWVIDKQSTIPVLLKSGVFYEVLVAVNGTNVSVVVDNKSYFTHTYAPRVLDGVAYGLNKGFVGVGSDNAKGIFDNVSARVLPPNMTLQQTESFTSGPGTLFDGANTGTWSTTGGRYIGTPSAGANLAVSLIDLGIKNLQLASVLDLSAVVNTAGRAGFVFDRYGPNDFKFVAIDAVTDQVLIGHSTARGGMVIDATVAKVINAGTDYTLALSLRNSSVSVSLNGQFAVSHGFNAVTVDGAFGLFTKGGSASFDTVTVKTNDPAFAAPQTLLASTAAPASADAMVTLSDAELKPLVEEALRRWSLNQDVGLIEALRGMPVRVADLPGLELGRVQDGVITIDADAAGHGWFIDSTPRDDREFVGSGTVLNARRGSGAAAGIDLLSVLAHEMGHAIGLGHSDGGVMGERLMPGQRATPEAWYSSSKADRQDLSEPALALPAFERRGAPQIDWTALPALSQTKGTAALLATERVASQWQSRFVNQLGARQVNTNAMLEVHLPLAQPLGRL